MVEIEVMGCVELCLSQGIQQYPNFEKSDIRFTSYMHKCTSKVLKHLRCKNETW